MKRLLITILISIVVLLGSFSCRNFEISYPDFDYTTGYFPYQFPVRTIILGDYIYDNSNDNNHQFMASIHIGGLYKNNKNRVFDIEIASDLSKDLLFNDKNGDTVRILPNKYFELQSKKIIVPKRKMYGSVVIKLKDAFFEDSRSLRLSYVLPLKIIGSNDVDSILRGYSLLPHPDSRIEEDWENMPKDFTLFAVKFINEYEGNYFYFGKSETQKGSQITDSIYRNQYVVRSPTVKLKSTKRHQVSMETHFYSKDVTDEINMLLTFDGDKCSISSNDNSLQISGTGIFMKKSFNWGNEDRDGIVLNYSVSDNGHNYTYKATDTLVLRDRGVVMETFTPILNK